MSYSTRDRDRYRMVVTGVTGATTAGALTATGLLIGFAADDFAGQQAAQEQASQQGAEADAAADRQVGQPLATQRRDDALVTRGLRHRPYVTRVTTRYVIGADTSGALGPGGAVTPDRTDQRPAPPPAAAAPPPPPAPAAPAPPPPPPAPSSGS